MKTKITKIEFLREVNNDMCHNWYFLVYVRIYSDDGTRYRKFRFIIWFDDYELCEYFEKDTYTKKDVREYAKEYAMNNLYSFGPKSYDDTKEFFDWCNQTIEDYNN